MSSISVIVPSSGRTSLGTTLASITPQLEPGDQLLVDVNADGDYGNAARRRMVKQAHADLLMFQDDDDVYLDGALAIARAAASRHPSRALIFRMLYRENRFCLWDRPELRAGNVASQMICIPNVPSLLGEWSDRYESDFDFVSGTCSRMGDPIWLEDIISLVHHPKLPKDEAVVS